MASTPVPAGSALVAAQQLPRLGWELFESAELRNNAVVEPVISKTDRSTQPSTQRVTSMFQATRPNTSDVKVGHRAGSARTSRTSLRTSIPTTVTAVSKVSSESAECPDRAVLTAIFSIDNISYDVNMFDDKMTWTPISSADIKRPSSHSAQTERPKRVLIVSPQSTASSQLWHDIIEPRLQTVGISGKFALIHKTKSVLDYVEKFLADQATSQGPESYDGILVLSKETFFAEVLNTVHNFKKELLKSGACHPAIPAVGFLPVSFVSFLGKELHGVADVETAIFHSIYGCIQSVPLCSFYDRDGSFIKHGLTASYGFSGGDTSAETTSKGFGTIRGSIRKGLAITKAIVQRRSYPCEIRYKDSPQNYEPYDDDEIFAEHEFSKFSVVNEHYDDGANDDPTPQQPTSDADSGVWPQCDKWDNLPRRNYLDITVTSLPQHAGNEDFESGCPLSAIFVRETMSRKDLLLGMGSQASLSSTTSKNKPKPEILDKTDIIRGSEIVIKPCGGSKTAATNSNSLSRWTIDGICIDAKVQELHVKVDECPILMYSRVPGQPLSMPSSPKNVVNLESNDAKTLSSSVV